MVPSKGRVFSLPLSLLEIGSGTGRTTQRGRFPFGSSCTCWYAYGQGPGIGPRTGERCWPLLAGVWRATAPLKKPWCTEGEVPTAVNLNLYRGLYSCVGWHSDNEPLFGVCGDAKLIVSLSFGSFAVFRWRRQSCSSDEGRSCRLGHGDIPCHGWSMPGRVPSSDEPFPGTGSDQRYVPLDQTTCFLLSFV